MTRTEDEAYFQRRAKQSTRLAVESTNHAARLAHRRMAETYERLAGLRDLP